jgi:hypothetical protein
MATKTLKTTPKITIKVWTSILDKFEQKMEDACLRRDAFITKVLHVELDFLDSEVSIPNSQASYEYVSSEIEKFDRKLVSLALPPELTLRLNEICKRKRIVRDAFFNRLFLLLSLKPKAIDSLLFQDAQNEWLNRYSKEYGNDLSGFEHAIYPLEPAINPFWAIRDALSLYAADEGWEDYIEPTNGKTIQIKREISGQVQPIDTVYATFLDQKVGGHTLIGMNCYVPDWRVPGHASEKAHAAKLDELFSSMETELGV